MPMTPERKASAIRACEMIEEDCLSDGHSLDGKPLDGLTIGTQFGNIYAAVATLAKIIKEDLSDAT